MMKIRRITTSRRHYYSFYMNIVVVVDSFHDFKVDKISFYIHLPLDSFFFFFVKYFYLFGLKRPHNEHKSFFVVVRQKQKFTVGWSIRDDDFLLIRFYFSVELRNEFHFFFHHEMNFIRCRNCQGRDLLK